MYSEEGLLGCVMPVGTAPLAEEDFSAAAAVQGEWLILKRCTIKRITFYVTATIAATTTAPVVTFRRRLAYAVSSGQSTIGTLTMPDTTAVGKILYKDVTPVTFNVGDTITLDNTQASVGGGASGKGIYGFEIDPAPEYKLNEGDMVLSA